MIFKKDTNKDNENGRVLCVLYCIIESDTEVEIRRSFSIMNAIFPLRIQSITHELVNEASANSRYCAIYM